jgi:hypothetical protein
MLEMVDAQLYWGKSPLTYRHVRSNTDKNIELNDTMNEIH